MRKEIRLGALAYVSDFNDAPLRYWIDNFRHCVRTALRLSTLLIFAGCADRSTDLQIVGLNYTDRYISMFSVNGGMGPNVSPNGGGGKFACCVTVPRRWRPGLTANIRWTNDMRSHDGWKSIIVEIPKYGFDDLGFIAVHFYPDDTIKVLITTKGTRYLGYPYPRPES